MDGPDIRYAKAHDGLALAYWTLGDGPGRPLIVVPAGGTSVEAWLRVPQALAWYQRLAQSRMVVCYDRRGAGLSDRPTDGEGWDHLRHVSDIGAVAEHLGLVEYDLWGHWHSWRWVLRRAEDDGLIRRIVLWRPGGSGGHTPEPRTQRIAALRAVRTIGDIDLWLSGLADLVVQPAPELRDAAIEVSRGAFTADEFAAFAEGNELSSNVREIQWAQVRNPTLVLHPAGLGYGEEMEQGWTESVRAIARSLPNARLRLLDGVVGLHEFTPPSVIEDIVEPFLDEDFPASPTHEPASSFQTIMFTDLESSTALTQRLGDAGAQKVLHGHNDAVRTSLQGHGGREVKHTGDGIMAAFPSAVRAVEAALQIQRDLAGAEVRVRIGLNAGEPIAEDDDFFGTAVQLAARICDRAEPARSSSAASSPTSARGNSSRSSRPERPT